MEDMKKKEEVVKNLICVIQNNNSEFEKQEAMMKILEMFEPFRKHLVKKFAGKGIDFYDICQVVDLKLIEAMHDYDESLDSSPIRHITSKARNGVFNYYKREMNYFREDRKTISLDSLSNMYQTDGIKINNNICANDDFALNSYFDEDYIIHKIMIEQEMHKLTEHQKDLIYMYYISDMTQEEIAEELNINQANVSRATKRGVKKLRESFNSSDVRGDMR